MAVSGIFCTKSERERRRNVSIVRRETIRWITIAECPAWTKHREELVIKLKINRTDRITLSLIVGKILEIEEYWKQFSHFAVSILKEKEGEERRRERISPPVLVPP